MYFRAHISKECIYLKLSKYYNLIYVGCVKLTFQSRVTIQFVLSNWIVDLNWMFFLKKNKTKKPLSQIDSRSNSPNWFYSILITHILFSLSLSPERYGRSTQKHNEMEQTHTDNIVVMHARNGWIHSSLSNTVYMHLTYHLSFPNGLDHRVV